MRHYRHKHREGRMTFMTNVINVDRSWSTSNVCRHRYRETRTLLCSTYLFQSTFNLFYDVHAETWHSNRSIGLETSMVVSLFKIVLKLTYCSSLKMDMNFHKQTVHQWDENVFCYGKIGLIERNFGPRNFEKEVTAQNCDGLNFESHFPSISPRFSPSFI